MLSADETPNREEAPQGPSAPSISLPKGGGAIRSLGEKFAANPVTGTGSMTVPIATSPGRSGFGPELALAYDSGSGNGPWGFGWSLGTPAISRKTNKGLPQYLDAEESDVFLLSGAEDLVPVLEPDGARVETSLEVDGEAYLVHCYRPRIEGLFARIERWTRLSDGDVHWRSLSRDNILTVYGRTQASRIADPQQPGRVFSWLICETRDDKGNAIVYDYKPEDGAGVDLARSHERNRGARDDPRRQANRYLKRIRYSNVRPLLDVHNHRPHDVPTAEMERAQWMFEVVFDYGEHDFAAPRPDDAGPWTYRSDPFSSYRAGFEVRTTRLCQRVLMFHHFADEPGVGDNCLVRSTDFTYSYELEPTDARVPVYTFLRAVNQYGYVRRDTGYLRRGRPPVEFAYSKPRLHDTVESVDPDSLENLPVGLDGAAYQWTDLHGDGIAGFLTEHVGAWLFKRNLSPINVVHDSDGGTAIAARFGPSERVAAQPNLALAGAEAQFMDLAGNGQPDVVALGGATPGFYERDGDAGWQSFRPFSARLNRNLHDPNLKFVDLTGDGHADVLITETEAFLWHASLAEAGFGPAQRRAKALDEEHGPRLVFADGTDSVHLADLSGDGLTDLVRIRNGEVCYWANLGYGRFGPKVTMDNAPRFDHADQFDPRRIRLADIDGSGTTDIIYLHREGVRLYFNQSGNSWSAARLLRIFPAVDNLATVTAVDLLGNGTTCLVWSSPLPHDASRPMRYVNLMREGKPHLLVRTVNNLGGETHITYAPSTKFYLQDRRDGRPWITKLPFPVHVVEKVTITDKWAKTAFTTAYSYHHGYFDGPEREFRGFGRVDQVDSETFGRFATANAQSPYITDDLTLYQPPVKTVTWFHTGAALHRQRLFSQYESEYFPTWFEALRPNETNLLGGFRENLLPEPVLHPHRLDGEEWREAQRACKGMMLRQEVYELDVDALERGEERPVRLFTTAYHNGHIRRLQARGRNPHAVFLVTESEAITYHYELDLRPATLSPDPRIAHTLNLQVDDHGNVLQSVTVVYPRIGRHTDGTLPSGTENLIAQVQRETHLAYTETRYTNDVNEGGQYRLRVPCEVLSYELTGLSPQDESDRRTPDPRDNRYFALDELRRFRLSQEHQSSGETVAELGYHERPNRTTPQKRLVEQVRLLFFEENLRDPLPFRTLNRLGLPYETYTLALTQALLDAVLREQLTAEVRAGLNDADRSGYLSGGDLAARFPGDTSGQYWVRSGIAGFAEDAAEHFYRPERYTDAFGNTTTLQHDRRDLYIQSSTDPAGNTVTVTGFDYRVLAPRAMRDINDNLSEAAFDVLGRPTAMALKGKGIEGDALDDYDDTRLDPDLATRLGFFSDPFDPAEARRLLGGATARHLYDFGEERAADGTVTYGHRPASTAGIVRERHGAWEREAGEQSPLQIAFEYSDGGGNLLVKKVRAEPDEEGGPPRWIAAGKTVLNNKGKPVKQYEPYFTESHAYEDPVAAGVTPLMYYDAVGRLVRTELPDGSFSRVVFTPWRVTTYDPNDTALEPGHRWYARNSDPAASPEARRAARLTAEHAHTPAETFLDSLGREVISVVHNRVREEDGTLRDEKYPTFTKLDAENKPLWIRDARGNLVMQYITPIKPTRAADEPDPANPESVPSGTVPCYDIAGNLLFQYSMDAGERWMLADASGQPLLSWDANLRITDTGDRVDEPRMFRTRYDALRRPVARDLVIGDDVWTVDRFEYGEPPEGAPDPEAADREAKHLNRRGQVYQHYDPSGLVTNARFDFKGNLLETTRQLASAYSAPVIDWSEGSPTHRLEAEVFTQRTEYDALNRMVRLENWHLPERAPAIYTPRYNERGLLAGETLSVRGGTTQAIRRVEYDAKGQRTLIHHGNDTRTTYDYDPETFRLIRLHTAGRDGTTTLQDLRYAYDPVGNITEIRDEAQQTVFFANARIEPHCTYTYDALYRLIHAAGREHAAQNNIQRDGHGFEPVTGIPFPNSPEALQRYTEEYQYDPVGNILSMTHTGGRAVRWKRCYQYAQDSNRLLATGRPADLPDPTDACPPHYVATPTLSQRYEYDTHGSMLTLHRTPDQYRLRWDHRDMIHHANLGGGGQAWYSYAADKQRTRKRIERNGSTVEERLYLGGMELYRRWRSDALVEEIETHHLFADDQRVLLVDDVQLSGTANLPEGILYRYQYGNHLGSVALELNADAEIISYEEYHPYGTTAYRTNNAEVRAATKRYRYTGMERDEETGLSYHTARYYAPWLGRWCSADPIGLRAGENVYIYIQSHVTTQTDKAGTQPETAETPRRVIAVTQTQFMEHFGEEFLRISQDIIDTGVLGDPNANDVAHLAFSRLSNRLDATIRIIHDDVPTTAEYASNSDLSVEMRHALFSIAHPVAALYIRTTLLETIRDIQAMFEQNNRAEFGLPVRRQEGRIIINTTNGSQENAFRHALSQALITHEFGGNTAIDFGAAHEIRPNIDTGIRRFSDSSNPDNALFLADTVIDLLNNSIGRRISLENSEATRREIALLVLEEFRNYGLFQALPDGEGSFIIDRIRLPDEQYQDARVMILGFDDELSFNINEDLD